MSKRNWYLIDAKAGQKEADVFIYDTVGVWGVSANDFVKDINNITADKINLRINSPGGSVFDGVAIFNSIKKHPAQVKTHIEALAASIASIIALAGDEVEIAENAFYMIHNPYTISVGDAENMRKTADLLDKITGTLIKTYMDKTGKDESEIRQLMDDETWFTAEEAKEAGFADAITDEEDVQAAFDLSVFNNVPQDIYNALNGGKPSPRKLEHALREAGGLSNSEAKAVVAKGYKVLDHREDEPGDGLREEDNKKIINNKGAKPMDLTKFKAEHSALHDEIVADARKGFVADSDIEAKVADGVKAETGRVKGVFAHLRPGREKLVAELMFDGKTTADAAAGRILAAEDESKGQALIDMKIDAEKPLVPAEPGDTTAQDNLPIEEKCKAKWESDAALQAEFSSFDAYLAFERAAAKGQAKILKK